MNNLFYIKIHPGETKVVNNTRILLVIIMILFGRLNHFVLNTIATKII